MALTNPDGSLPANDGMHSLRQKLQEIKQLAVSTEEKARRMHFLMTQDYLKHKNAPVSSWTDHHPSETADLGIQNPPLSPVVGETPILTNSENPYNLQEGDLEPGFSTLPKAPKDADDDGDEPPNDHGRELGCVHYKRNVKVQCYDCHRWFPCRHCHDQAKDLPFIHILNRKKTQNMLCMLCQTPQPAAEVCVNCGEYAAYYYCPKCKLWDNDSDKRIYHCDDCGICRVGEGIGKDYVHCRRCNVCISISCSAAHPCIERATEGDCPLCLIPLFESRTPVVSLPCGHYMHGDCYKDLMAVTYKCPVCSKSAVNMELQWRKLDDEIAAQPMPDEDEVLGGLLPHVDGHALSGDARLIEEDPHGVSFPPPRRPRQVWIGCNDCGARSWATFHWLGLKCQRCDSYNTNQMAPTAVHETDAERLMRQQQVHRHDFTGNSVLRDAGIGVADPDAFALEPPASPIQQAAILSSSSNSSSPIRLAASGAQSPGRYFVHANEPRQFSFNAPRFSAPSMPNLPTLPTLTDMPRMPRMPNLPNLPNIRQNLPMMPNVELPRFSPYEMIDAFSRGLSPMRYYLRGLDLREDDELDARIAAASSRPSMTQRSLSTTMRRGQVNHKRRTGSPGSANVVDESDLWDPTTDEEELGSREGYEGHDSDSLRALEAADDSSSDNDDDDDNDDESDEEEEEEDGMGAAIDDDDDDDDDGAEDWYLLGHR